MIYTFNIFRYDPKKDREPRRQEFQVDLGDADKMTVLDALFRIQQTQDKTLSFRYSCRLAMCGSCALVINAKEGLACKTLVKDLGPGTIFLDPLRHIPVINDLQALWDKTAAVIDLKMSLQQTLNQARENNGVLAAEDERLGRLHAEWESSVGQECPLCGNPIR